jgi:hypothetical protein
VRSLIEESYIIYSNSIEKKYLLGWGKVWIDYDRLPPGLKRADSATEVKKKQISRRVLKKAFIVKVILVTQDFHGQNLT